MKMNVLNSDENDENYARSTAAIKIELENVMTLFIIHEFYVSFKYCFSFGVSTVETTFVGHLEFYFLHFRPHQDIKRKMEK